MTALVIRRRKKTAKATAQHVGVSVRTIQRWIAEERSTYEATAAARRQQAHDLRQEGMSWAEVAEAMGCSTEAAKQLGKRFREITKASSGTA